MLHDDLFQRPLIAAELELRTQGNVWLGVNSATVLLAYLWTLRRPARAGISWSSVTAGLALTTVGVTLVGTAPAGWIVGVGIVVLSIGELLSIPVLYHLVSEHAPAHARSRYFGFIWVAGAFGRPARKRCFGRFRSRAPSVSWRPRCWRSPP